MPDIFAGFDILGLGTLLGSLLFLGALVWLLVDNRSFDEVNRRHAAAVDRAAPTVTAEEVEVRARSLGVDRLLDMARTVPNVTVSEAS